VPTGRCGNGCISIQSPLSKASEPKSESGRSTTARPYRLATYGTVLYRFSCLMNGSHKQKVCQIKPWRCSGYYSHTAMASVYSDRVGPWYIESIPDKRQRSPLSPHFVLAQNHSKKCGGNSDGRNDSYMERLLTARRGPSARSKIFWDSPFF
jgi:hypothetical protein